MPITARLDTREMDYWQLLLKRIRKKRSRWRSRPEPPHLYHYTSSAAFIEIIKSGQLWFSDFRTMNDVSEVHYGIEVLKDKLYSLRETELRDYVDDFVAFDDRLEEVPNWIDVFFLSLCEEDNLLNQWRVYGRDSVPVSIEFDMESIMPGAWDHYSFDIMPLVYDPATQEHFIESICGVLVDSLRKQKERFDVETFTAACMDWCIRMKHPQFEVEKEWRFVARFGLEHRTNALLNHRATSNGIVPYLAMKPTNRKLPISGVTIGPCRNPESQLRAVRDFLRVNGYGHVTVTASTLPIRA